MTHSGPEVLFKTCVAIKFVDDDDDDLEWANVQDCSNTVHGVQNCCNRKQVKKEITGVTGKF